MTEQQIPFFIVAIPFLSAFLVSLFGFYNKKWAWPITVLALGGSTYAALHTLCKVIQNGVVSYHLSGWRPPYGIEYRVDHLNAMVLLMVAAVSFLVAIFAKENIEKELPEKISHYYTLFLLLVTGLLGITITGDAFNLYVLLEISALTSYALIAFGGKRAFLATFNYVMLGTIGASLYLLGIGYLFIKTGSLNIMDMSQIILSLHGSQAIFVGFVLILIGLWIKMAFFPLHSWLPNAYSNAPTATSALIAPLMTKVTVYVMARVMYTLFSSQYIYQVLSFSNIVVWLSCVAILAGSLFALTQTRLKKMLTFLIVAEVGYMVGGLWLGNKAGFSGATYHILADGVMTACLFMAVGSVIYKAGHDGFDALKGLYQKMPLTSIGFTIGAFSMIGIPPTCGFFSKWYLLSGALQAGHWGFFVALILSSLINAFLFFRLIEICFFQATSDETPDHHAHQTRNESPITITIPLLISALAILGIGLFTNEIMTHIIQHIVPKGLS